MEASAPRAHADPTAAANTAKRRGAATPRRSRRRWARLIVSILVFFVIGGYLVHSQGRLALSTFAFWRQDWQTARRHAEAHLVSHPKSRPGLLLLARSFREVGDWQAAQRIYERLPALPLADRRKLADYYRTTQQTAKSLDAYQRIVEHDPEDAEALLSLALLYQDRGDAAEARDLAQKATRLVPDRVQAWVCLSKAHLALVEPKAAADTLRRAIGRNPPEAPQLRKMLADILLLHLAEPVEAERELTLALKANPQDAESLWMIGESFLLREPPKFDVARDHLLRAVEIDPKNHRALLLLAGIAVGQADWEEASRYVDQLLRHHPADKEALHLRRICQERPARPIRQLPLRGETPVVWRFSEVATSMGVTFRHDAGENREWRFYPETLGSGVAIFDYDGDGWMDLYFVTFNQLRPDKAQTPAPSHNVLYRNLGGGRFQDVTPGSGLDVAAFGHGVAVGDYDNDGDPDVYLANYGPNKLLRNNGDGTFVDVTLAAGVADYPTSMSTSAAWFDYDDDGDLDLYVCNYSVYDVSHPQECTRPGLGRIYCGPDSMPSQRHTLFRNDGDGTFRDVTESMGIARNETPQKMGKGLGVVAADLNDDGKVDLFVANDLTPNFLFWSDGRRLHDVSEPSGVDRNKDGHWESCMGADAGDVDGDGDFDLIVTNQWMEKNTLYRNLGNLLFHDASAFAGLTSGTRRAVGWGTALVDFDNDGDLDSFVTNGHFYDWREPEQPFRQTAMLWKNGGDGVFEDISRQAGPYFQQPVAGRGAAFGDLDNDGDCDIVLNHWNDTAAILRNDTQVVIPRASSSPTAETGPPVTNGAWVRLELIGVESNRDAVGTALEVRIGTRLFFYQRKGGGSYLSANDPRVLIGLGLAKTVDRLKVRWPSGREQIFEGIPVNRSYRLGEGHPLQPRS